MPLMHTNWFKFPFPHVSFPAVMMRYCDVCVYSSVEFHRSQYFSQTLSGEMDNHIMSCLLDFIKSFKGIDLMLTSSQDVLHQISNKLLNCGEDSILDVYMEMISIFNQEYNNGLCAQPWLY